MAGPKKKQRPNDERLMVQRKDQALLRYVNLINLLQ